MQVRWHWLKVLPCICWAPIWLHVHVVGVCGYCALNAIIVGLFYLIITSCNIEGILPKGPYLPCVSMAGRALLAGYHRYVRCEVCQWNLCLAWFLKGKLVPRHTWVLDRIFEMSPLSRHFWSLVMLAKVTSNLEKKCQITCIWMHIFYLYECKTTCHGISVYWKYRWAIAKRQNSFRWVIARKT